MRDTTAMLGLDAGMDCETAASAPAPVGRAPSGQTVLVADDDAAHRAHIAEMLSGQGYSVVLASDGEEALSRIVAGGVDLLIAAVSMPRITGLELLQAMRDIERRPHAVMIAPGMTEMDGVYLKAAGAMGAACGYTWPLTPSVFFRDISNLLGQASEL